MESSLSRVLVKIFARGFYRVHAGLFLFVFLALVGSVEAGQLLNYHKTLMLAFITSPLMLMVVFVIWLLYSIKTWHYTAGQIFGVNQQFLFYSSTSFSKGQQLKAWMLAQGAMLMPIIAYGLTAVVVGAWHHYYLSPLVILLYLVLLIWLGGFIYTTLVNRQIDGGKQSLLLRFGTKWRKPFYSLFIYQVFDNMKVRYVITKTISYFIVTGVFLLFADVSHDVRVAGIAMLAIATAHAVLIFEERKFEETYLIFARGLPQTRLRLFAGFALVYLMLLLPEGIWLFSRFNPLLAVELLAFGLSIVLLFHSLLYWMGLNMDRYLQYVLGLFMGLFFVILYRQIAALIVINGVVAYLVFYNNYYTTFAVKAEGE
ncbi:hypothetical protein [Mucilaginibacter boryungensis]|uniref:CAAX prenyl protease-like protein n=1 Tax=Mucilaginibacter boryungensis TaxID=768480 RepID=A0ABR9XIU9_9SPHI|nr:hypothetical protein [Mucilaginibacter boryungensis]MBE9667132.1 hypothetical protein [Mucilaginibacter boryungensis]